MGWPHAFRYTEWKKWWCIVYSVARKKNYLHLVARKFYCLRGRPRPSWWVILLFHVVVYHLFLNASSTRAASHIFHHLIHFKLPLCFRLKIVHLNWVSICLFKQWSEQKLSINCMDIIHQTKRRKNERKIWNYSANSDEIHTMDKLDRITMMRDDWWPKP